MPPPSGGLPGLCPPLPYWQVTGLQLHTHHAILGLSAVLQQSWVEGPTSTPTWPLPPPCLRTLHPFPLSLSVKPSASWDPIPLHPQLRGLPPFSPSHQSLWSCHDTSVAPTSSLLIPQPSPKFPETTTHPFALTFDPKAWVSIPSAWTSARCPYSALSVLAPGSLDPHLCPASPGLSPQPPTNKAPGQTQRPQRPSASK